MSAASLLYRKQYDINDDIHIVIPTVGEIIDKEEEYYTLVSSFTSMPIDFMAQLDEVGIDFTAINELAIFQIVPIIIS